MLFPCYLPSLNPSLRMENEESSWPVVDVRERRKLQNKASPIIPPAGRGENEERRNISASQTQLQLQASLTGMGKSSMEREGPASTQSSQAKARLPRRGPWARSLLCWSLPSHPLSPSLYVSRSLGTELPKVAVSLTIWSPTYSLPSSCLFSCCQKTCDSLLTLLLATHVQQDPSSPGSGGEERRGTGR